MTFDAESVLVATGREPADCGLELHATSVQRGDDGWITVDGQMSTTDPRVYAIGDAIAADGHASSARMQGRTAAEAVAGWNAEFDARVIPRVIFTTPPLAWCGLTARGAADAGYEERGRRRTSLDRASASPPARTTIPTASRTSCSTGTPV